MNKGRVLMISAILGIAVALLLLALLAVIFSPLISGWLVGLLLSLFLIASLYAFVVGFALIWLLSTPNAYYGPKRRAFVMPIRKQLLIVYGLIDMLLTKEASRLKLQRGLVVLNNQILDGLNLKVMASELTVLTPHCIQRSKCALKVTGADNNCTQCGLCGVGDLKRLAQEYQIHIAIATGGTLARQLLKRYQPKLVIAVACERDLVSGLRDASSIPVYGVYNERPNGPCVDTAFDVSLLEALIKKSIIY